MVFKLGLVGAFGARRGAEERFRKHERNYHHKSTTLVINMLPPKGPPKCFFGAF
jgi:hypothetical protein